MIYVTLLPTSIVKIGRGTRIGRAYHAQVFFVEDVRVLALWETGNSKAAEMQALAACKPYRIRGELHQGDPAEIVAAITAVIGEPSIVNPPKYGRGRPRRGEDRVTIEKCPRIQAQDLIYKWRHYKSKKRCDLI
jgi:hypothetical protein